MALRVGINGFGRIGRAVCRIALKETDLEIVAVNSRSDAKTLAHLLKYDTVYGRLPFDVAVSGDTLSVAGRTIRVTREVDPERIPWDEAGVDVVVEATGKWTSRADAGKHLRAGVRGVVITAPSPDPDLTLVMGVNEAGYDPDKHRIVSCASCTTNAVAPILKVIDDRFGVNYCMMTTVHSYTSSQNLVDGSHKDLRRSRAAAANVIPTTTGAARAIARVLPHLEGRVATLSLRIPSHEVSLLDLSLELERETDASELNRLLQGAAEGGAMQGILGYTDEPLVSSDFVGDPRSSVIDSQLTQVVDGRLAKVVAWYDNEWAYAQRVLDVIRMTRPRASGRSFQVVNGTGAVEE